MFLNALLAPYALTLKIRHALYDKGVWKVHTCEVPTICVGNITAGGTGKTPHTEMILRTLLESSEWGDRNIAVLSRGHKRNSKGFQQVMADGSARFCGDEPLQIKRKFPSVTVAVDRDRIVGCDFLIHPDKINTSKAGRRCRDKQMPPSDIIILDDAFQYRDLRAHINIVLVDYNRPISKDHLLPFGRLRDLPERLNFADMIIVTKCPAYMEGYEKIAWAKSLGIYDFDPDTCLGTNKSGQRIHVFFTAISYSPLQPVYPELGDIRYTYSKKLILFSGIAKDTPLRRFLSDSYKIVRRFNFFDHHRYTGHDIRRIKNATKNHPTAVVATTEKDSQRIRDSKKVPESLKTRMFQIPIVVTFLSEKEEVIFRETLISALKEFRSEPAQTPRG